MKRALLFIGSVVLLAASVLAKRSTWVSAGAALLVAVTLLPPFAKRAKKGRT